MSLHVIRRSLASLGLAAALSTGCSAEYLYSPDYVEAAQAVLARRYVDARTVGDRLLEGDPSSIEGHAVLGQVHLRGEEDLGLADLHLRKARRLLEQRFPIPLGEDAPVALHQDILRNLRQTSYLRERYAETLQVIDEYNALYDPDLEHLRGWPLMKLGRTAEAERVVLALQGKLAEDDPGQVDLWDTLGQLSYERGDLQEAEEHFLRASGLETDTADQPDPVYLTNVGEVQRDRLSFADAEATWREAVGWPNPASYAEPHDRLACLYAGAARFQEALQQLEQAATWRYNLWPQVSAHTRASHLTSVGEVFVALGDSERALDALRRALASPHRQALISGRTQVPLAKRYLLYAAALELSAREAWERRSWSRGWESWRAGRLAAEHQVLAAWARARAAVVLARSAGVQAALSPYGPGAMQSPWLLPLLSRALTSGTTRAALRGPAVDEVPEASRYQALLGGSTGASLPAEEALARAAVEAAQGRWSEALRIDPAVTRRAAISLGVTVKGPAEVASLLESSPAFHEGSDLSLQVEENLSATLSDSQGVVLVRVDPQPDARSLVSDLHRVLFTRRSGWTDTRLDAVAREPNPGRMASARLEELLVGE